MTQNTTYRIRHSASPYRQGAGRPQSGHQPYIYGNAARNGKAGCGAEAKETDKQSGFEEQGSSKKHEPGIRYIPFSNVSSAYFLLHQLSPGEVWFDI